MDEQKRIQFLIGLEKLTRETGIIISGCGCCGSPFLVDAEDGDLDERAGYGSEPMGPEVVWIAPNDQRDWERYSDTIVKEKT